MSHISRRALFNRTLLVVAVTGGAAAGLTKSVHHKVALPPAAPPSALLAALDTQKRLLGGYDSALTTSTDQPALTALRADIAAHGTALRAVLENYPGWRYAQSTAIATATASTAPAVAGTRAALAATSKAGADAATKACLAWPVGEDQAAQVVPLLGSIAACLITHAGVLA
jgi:hypothetical protein